MELSQLASIGLNLSGHLLPPRLLNCCRSPKNSVRRVFNQCLHPRTDEGRVSAALASVGFHVGINTPVLRKIRCLNFKSRIFIGKSIQQFLKNCFFVARLLILPPSSKKHKNHNIEGGVRVPPPQPYPARAGRGSCREPSTGQALCNRRGRQ